MFSKLAPGIVDEALRVDEPYTFASLLLRHALQLEEAHELHTDSDSSRASAEEEDTVVGEGAPRGRRR